MAKKNGCHPKRNPSNNEHWTETIAITRTTETTTKIVDNKNHNYLQNKIKIQNMKLEMKIKKRKPVRCSFATRFEKNVENWQHDTIVRSDPTVAIYVP